MTSHWSSSRQENNKGRSNFHPELAYDLDNTRKSVGSVNRSVLNSFLEDTRSALKQSKSKTTPKQNLKTDNTNKNEITGPTENRVRSTKKDTSSALEQSKKKITSNKKLDITKNVNVLGGANANRTKSTNKVAFDVEEEELPDYLNKNCLNTSPRVTISNRSKNTTKVKKVVDEGKLSGYANKKYLGRSYDEKPSTSTKPDSKSASNNTKAQAVSSSLELRSSLKYSEFKDKPKSVSVFSIEDIDWYYEDADYYNKKLRAIMSDFAIPKENRREGNAKLSYTYFLLDSRWCINKRNTSWIDFINAIFYIGKGKGDRAFEHAVEAEKSLSLTSTNKKIRKIKEIWRNDHPIKVFIITENIIAEEAYTREAAMIDAVGLSRLCNKVHGSYYGVTSLLKARERQEIGAMLLMEARDIFRWKGAIDVYQKEKAVSVSSFKSKYDNVRDSVVQY